MNVFEIDFIEQIRLNRRRRQNERSDQALYAENRAATKGAGLLHDIFRYRYRGHKSTYRARYLRPYHDFTRTPVSQNPAENTYYTLLPNGSTLRFFLPIFAETAHRFEMSEWSSSRTNGKTIAWYHTRARRFEMSPNSPLVRLAQQYDVRLPNDVRFVTPRQMRAFFNQVQTAVYDAAAADPVFTNSVSYDYFNSNETLFRSMEYKLDQFFRVSLFAQAYDTALTWAEYKVLYAFRFETEETALGADTLGTEDQWQADYDARRAAQTLILNNLLTGDPSDAKKLMGLHVALLTDLYASDEHDPRYAHAPGDAMGLLTRV